MFDTSWYYLSGCSRLSSRPHGSKWHQFPCLHWMHNQHMVGGLKAKGSKNWGTNLDSQRIPKVSPIWKSGNPLAVAAPWHSGWGPHCEVGSTGRLFQGQQQHARTLGLVLESPAGVTGSQWQQSCSEVLGQPRVGFVDVLCFWLLSVSQ